MAGFTLPLVNPALGAPDDSAMPSMPNLGASAPMAPMAPVAPAGLPMPMRPVPSQMPPQQQGGGGIQELLKQLLPVLVSGIAAKRGGAVAGNAVLTGYAQGIAKKHKEELEQQEMIAKLDATNLDAQQAIEKATQERKYKLSQFIENITKQVNGIDDPVTFAATVSLADQTAQEAFGAAPGFIKGSLVFNGEPIRLEKEKKEANALIERFIKNHGRENLDAAIASGAMVNGKKLSDLLKLTEYDVTLPSGERFTPTVADDPDITNEASFIKSAVAAARAKAKGAQKPWTSADSMKAATEARRQWSDSGRAESGGPDPLLQELRELRLQQARDAAKFLSPQQQVIANRLADDYTRESKDFVLRSQSYGTVLASAKDPSPAGDLSLIFAYMKMLDPGSTVREGEFATAQNSAAVPDQIRNFYNKITQGTRLNPKQRADFVARAKGIYKTAQRTHAPIMRQYEARADQSGVPRNFVVMDYSQGVEEPTGTRTEIREQDGVKFEVTYDKDGKVLSSVVVK